jgi:hypothetical protein
VAHVRIVVKSFPAFAAAALLAGLFPGTVRAQTVDFLYVAPKAALQAAFGAAAAPGDTGFFDTGYAHVRITAANEATFRTAAHAHLRTTFDDLKAGTAFRRRIDEILQMSGGVTDVTVALVDDRTGISTAARLTPKKRRDGTRFVWPAASVRPATAPRYRGFIGLGVAAADTISSRWPGNWKAWQSTIMHEFSHTQFVNEKMKWGAVNVVYGGDGGHWWEELLGEQDLTFEEGFGTFFGLIDNPEWWRRTLLPFFRNAGTRYLVESRSVLAGVPELWNAPHTEEERTPPDGTGRYFIRKYKWSDVPGFYVLFNENNATAFHYFYYIHANSNRDSSYAMIRREGASMSRDRRKRVSAYAVNRLALQLEDFAATPDGATCKRAGTLTSSLFPFALLDVLTHFGMTDAKYKREHDAMYPDRVPKAYANYWARRAAIKALVQADLDANPVRIEEAVQKISDYCHRADTILATGP